MALYSTIVQLQKMREHQRISVTPKLSFYLQDSRYIDRFGLWIENHGLGPAEIDSVIICVDEERIDTDDPSLFWDHVLKMLLRNNVPVDLISYKNIYKEWYVPGYCLQANAEAVFFGVPEAFSIRNNAEKMGSEATGIIYDTTRDVLQHIDITIHYTSFFGEMDSVLFEHEKIQYDF